MVKEICIIDDKKELIQQIKALFKDEKEYNFNHIKTKDIDIALKCIPALIIINADEISLDIVEMCKKIRSNEDNNITPILVVGNETNKEHRLEILNSEVEFYIKKPIDEDYLYYTIKNIVRLMYKNRGVNPLTGLSGNIQIQAEMKRRLLKEETFQVLYFDLDNFKAYNDKYGFVKGDEIIKFTSQLILKNIHDMNLENPFVGHIGGDDFVAILSGTDCENICQNITIEFDHYVLEYFDNKDIEKGYIEVENRKGVIEEFPIVSLSIAVVVVDPKHYKTTFEIGEIGAQVKHVAKTTMGSVYIINRRK